MGKHKDDLDRYRTELGGLERRIRELEFDKDGRDALERVRAMEAQLPPFPNGGLMTCPKCGQSMVPSYVPARKPFYCLSCVGDGNPEHIKWRCGCGYEQRTHTMDAAS